jgi:thiamine-phosphate pyrophosphorylase
MAEQRAAQPSTPVLGTPFWHQDLAGRPRHGTASRPWRKPSSTHSAIWRPLHHDANSVELTPQPVPPHCARSLPIWRRCRPAAPGLYRRGCRTLAQAWQRQSERTNQFDVTHWPDDPRLRSRPADPPWPCPARARWACTACCPRPNGWAAWPAPGCPRCSCASKSDKAAAIRAEVRSR